MLELRHCFLNGCLMDCPNQAEWNILFVLTNAVLVSVRPCEPLFWRIVCCQLTVILSPRQLWKPRTWNELPQEQHLRAGPASVGCVDGHRFNGGADWPSRRWDIGESREYKYLNSRISGNTSSPVAEVADSEVSWPPLSVYVPGWGLKIPGKGRKMPILLWVGS